MNYALDEFKHLPPEERPEAFAAWIRVFSVLAALRDEKSLGDTQQDALEPDNSWTVLPEAAYSGAQEAAA